MAQQFGEEKAKVLDESGALYQAGLGLFQAGDIREAEECFASAVRPFLSKNTMRSIYVSIEDFTPQLLDSMYHMGLIYLEYGRSDSSGIHDHFSSAAAIFQYCS